MSALSFGPALRKLINRKDMVQNKYSEKGCRDVLLNITGEDGAVSCFIINLTVPCQMFVTATCDGNAVCGELYSDTAVYLDEENVVNPIDNDFHVQSANQMVGLLVLAITVV